MASLSSEVETRYKKDPAGQGFWEKLIHFLGTEVKIDNIKIESKIGPAKAGITASLKDDPTFKQRLQEGLRGHVAPLVRQAHEFSSQVVELVRKQTAHKDKKVVLLVDSVEQIRGVGDEAEDVYKSVVNLFSGHADKLRLPLLHVVYTIPPYLTPLAPATGRFLDSGPVYSLPSVHVRHKKGGADKKGLGILERIIAKRYKDWENVFSKDQIHDLGQASGGDLRDFFRLIKDCLVTATTASRPGLPVGPDTIVSAKNHLRRDMLPIATEDLKWLKRIYDSKEPGLETTHELPKLAHFFDTSLVLNYHNGDDWYDVHPLLEDLLKQAE